MPRRSLAVRVLTAAPLVAGVAVVLASPVGAEPGFTQVQAMSTPLGGAPHGGAYAAVSCTSATACVAVGTTVDGALLSAVTETSGHWGTPVKVALPDTIASFFTISGLSCRGAGACAVAATYEATDGSLDPLLVTEVAGTWQAATTIALPSGALTGSEEFAYLTDVDCVSVGNCVAIGSYEDDANDPLIHGFALTQVSGGAWTTTKLPDIGTSSNDGSSPASLSCSDTSDCTAVGAQNDPSQNGLAWRRTSGTWSTPTNIAAAGDSTFQPLAVACPDAATCVAVGDLQGEGTLPGYAIETSGTWATAASLPLPALSPKASAGELLSISCDTAAVCEAVGEFGGYLTISGGHTPGAAGAATWSGGSWSSIDYVRGVRAGASRANYAQLSSVSCVTTTLCTAVGASSDLAAKGQPEYPFSATLSPVRTVSNPLPPTGVVGKGVPGAALISWQAPVDDGGAAVRSFTATAEPGSHTCTTKAESCALRGLLNGHGYRVNVTDRTSYGSSVRAVDPALVVAGRAPTTPAGLHLAFASRTLTVTWHPSSSPTGEPVRYTVTVHAPHGVVRRLATSHLRVTVPAIASGTYVIVIVAKNASGSSKPRQVRASKG